MRVHLRSLDPARPNDAACGFSIYPRTLTDQHDAVTCGHCRRIVADLDRVDDDRENARRHWSEWAARFDDPLRMLLAVGRVQAARTSSAWEAQQFYAACDRLRELGIDPITGQREGSDDRG